MFDPRKEDWICITPIRETETRNLIACILQKAGIEDAYCLKNTPPDIMLPYILYDAQRQIINTWRNIDAYLHRPVTLKELLAAAETIINAKSINHEK